MRSMVNKTLTVAVSGLALAALLFTIGTFLAPNQQASAQSSTPAPQNLRHIITKSTTSKMQWDAVSVATSYEIMRRQPDTQAPGVFNAAGTVQAPTTTYTDTGLTPSTKYVYRVVAIGPDGRSPKSNYINVRTWTSTSLGFQARYIKPNSVEFHWRTPCRCATQNNSPV